MEGTGREGGELMETKITPLAKLQADFERRILPVVKNYAAAQFADWKRAGRQRDYQDAMADVGALAWKMSIGAAKGGKDPVALRSSIARFAVRQVRCGRSVTGQGKAKCVYTAHSNGRVKLCSIPDEREDWHVAITLALCDDTQSPIPTRVAFRIDFPEWLRTLSDRNRALIGAMMQGHETSLLAKWFSVTPGRISQLRASYCRSWHRFLHRDQAPATR